MPTVNIIDPGAKTEKPQKFTVRGTSDAATGSPITCTITKGPFSETGSGVVDGNKGWSVPLGVTGPIPKDKGYAITARLSSGSGSDGVEEITITDKLPIEILEIKIEPGPGDDRTLIITGKVKDKPSFNAPSVLIHASGPGQKPRVVSAGWIRPIPGNLKWKIKLKAPGHGHVVVHVLGINCVDGDGGDVIVQIMEAVPQ